MSKKNVIVIGDVVLDELLYLQKKEGCERGAQDQPIPQYDVVKFDKMLGGAYNVAHLLQNRVPNIDVMFCSTLSSAYTGLLSENIAYLDLFPKNPNGKFSVKRRYVDQERVQTRHDYYKPQDKCSNDEIYEWVKRIDFSKADMTVISDYQKGAICSEKVAQHIIANSKIVIVDTKNPNLDWYTGADFIKLNFGEYMNVHEYFGPKEEDIVEHLAPHRLIITRGSEETMFIYTEVVDGEATGFEVRVKPKAVETASIVDTIGSGDAFVAGFVSLFLETGDAYQAIGGGHDLALTNLTKIGAQW